MGDKKTEFFVGVFVILSVAALLMLALQVSGLSDLSRIKQGYKIHAEFENVGGLKVRAKVSIAGVTIGRVVAINLDNDSHYANVDMIISSEVKIPDDSKAKILTAGLLGDNYIGIEPGISETSYLKNNDKMTQTYRAVVLEDLISKFAVGGGKNENN